MAPQGRFCSCKDADNNGDERCKKKGKDQEVRDS